MRRTMIRPQLKDMYQSGLDARMVGLDAKKAKALQPPMNASPGELRLWRKLNGMLNEDEKKVDEFEHGKAKSRQHAYPGTRGAPGKRRPSEAELLYGAVPKPSAGTPAGKKSRASTGGSQANSPRSASPRAGSSKNATPANRAASPMRAPPRNDTPIRSRPAPQPSLQQSKQKHAASPRVPAAHLPPKAPKTGGGEHGGPLKAYKDNLDDHAGQPQHGHKQTRQQQHRRPQPRAAPIQHEDEFEDEQHEAAYEEEEMGDEVGGEPSYSPSAEAGIDSDSSQRDNP